MVRLSDSSPNDSSAAHPSKKRKKKKPMPLPMATKMSNGGKLIYFGVEVALCGDSPGNLFKFADLLQYVNIYKTDQAYLPQSLLLKVFLSN